MERMAKKKAKPRPPPSPPTIHEATLASGPSGAVIRGAEIDLTTAIGRRQAGLDVVVCGDDVKANSRLARQIEASVGPSEKETPHKRVGPCALPHYQPITRPPAGHTFYETDNPQRKARRRNP
jgi:hypothetical protein